MHRGHKLVQDHPDSAQSWFGVGCYYLASRQLEAARRYFAKATQLDRHCAAAWVGFGHAFAEQVRAGMPLHAWVGFCRVGALLLCESALGNMTMTHCMHLYTLVTHANARATARAAAVTQDESDQALAAYRTASRLFPGLHTPLLGMGCAYARMNSGHLAERCFLQAAAMCPHDPAVAHELGVLTYRCAAMVRCAALHVCCAVLGACAFECRPCRCAGG